MKLRLYLVTIYLSILCIIALPLHANERIVTAGGSITEIIYALGAQDQLVGVDMTSTYPEEVKLLPQIGYWKQLNIEGVLSLNPSLLITWQDAEQDRLLAQLGKANVDVLSLQRVPNNIDLLFKNIRRIADKIERTSQGEELIAKISAEVRSAQQHSERHKTEASVLFLLSISGTSQVSGKNTVADSVITLAGGKNAAEHNGYKNFSAEAFITANPDIILVTTQSLETIGGKANLANFPGIMHTNAWKNDRIMAIDQALILGMGPRVGEAVTILSRGFYPN